MNPVVYEDDGYVPVGLIHHGYDQRITMIARAEVDGIKRGDMVRLKPSDPSRGWEASKNLVVVASGFYWIGAVVRGYRHRTATPTDSGLKAGDLLEVQVGGYFSRALFPENTEVSAAGHVLIVDTSAPYFDSAAETVLRYANPRAFARVETNHSATLKDLHFLGQPVYT